jgi:hypothetical protein
MRLSVIPAATLALLGLVPPAGAWTITVTGTIYSGVNEPFAIDGNGVFGLPGSPLVGSTYTETITTDPLQSSLIAFSPPVNIERSGGPQPGFGGAAAPYYISVTVNGFTYTETESSPFLIRSYLNSEIANGLGSQDQVYQEINSAGCTGSYGPCRSSYILAYSGTPLVPSLDFDQSIFASTNLDPGSRTYFLFRDGPIDPGTIQQYSGFYGSVDTLAVNVPEPSTWATMLLGFVSLGFVARRRRQFA